MNTSPCCKQNVIVEKSLDLQLRRKRANQSFKWGIFNIILSIILFMDISNKCPYAFSKWYYVEYAVTFLLCLSAFVNFARYFYFILSFDPIKGSAAQKNLLKFEDTDNSFITTQPAEAKIDPNLTPMNATLLSWHSSFNDSNRVLSSSNWAYARHSPQRTESSGQNTSWNASVQNNSALNTSGMNNSASFTSPYSRYAKRDDVITDQKGLQQYLKDVSNQEYDDSEIPGGQNNFGPTSINSFWNYCNNAANLLKTSLYQLSPSTVSPGKQTNKDETNIFGVSNDFDGNSEIIRKISSTKLSQYVANLRMWMSCTILQRLEAEISKVDAAFKSRGFSDIQIGNVGLERLKKTAENQQFVSLHVPMLPMIVPFLEMSTNQEYLVQRIKYLSKGSCIADYRWNSGSSYHGLNWDEHLPTDSAILFHVFCAYLDSQLMPLPQPGGRPFFNRYVIIGDKKSVKETLSEVKNKSRCAILCTNQLKPKFNFISDDKIHTCTHDRNNLFYVIIQFLIYMKTYHEGLLEGVNLGKSGINILCVIED